MKSLPKLWKWRLAQHLEIRWWKNYLKSKDKDTYYQWKKSYWNDFIQRTSSYAPLRPGMKILDAGCGPAGLVTVLSQQQVTAVDPLLPDYQKQLPHFEPGDYPHTRFINLPLEVFVEPGSFDQVYCVNVINHVNDPAAVIENLACCLIQGGIMVLSVDAHKRKWLKKIFQWIPGDVLHPHQQDLNQYVKWLTQAGFRILKTDKLKSEAIFDYWLILAEKR